MIYSLMKFNLNVINQKSFDFYTGCVWHKAVLSYWDDDFLLKQKAEYDLFAVSVLKDIYFLFEGKYNCILLCLFSIYNALFFEE